MDSRDAAHPVPPAGQEEWQAVFRDAQVLAEGPRQVAEAQARILERLASAYASFERLDRQHAALLKGVIDVFDLCAALRSRPPEVRALMDQLQKLLAEQGVRPYLPHAGDLPDGCDVLAFVETCDIPAGTVYDVPTPGYLRSDGVLLRRAGVRVAQPPLTPPAAHSAPGGAAAAERPESERASGSLGRD